MSRIFEKRIQLPAKVIFIVAACVVAYVPAMRGEFIWDDETYVVENKLLTEPDGLYRIWFTTDSPSQYFPLVYTTFRFEHKLWGLNPLGFHIVNLLLHVANSLLLWLLIFRLGIPAAWLAAAIFALHPVQVESAAWITERKNVLMTFFLFLSLLTWFRFIEGPRQSGRRWGIYLLSLLLYALALFSKTTACTLPAALVLILWFKRIRLDKKRWLEIVPYLLLGLAMSFVTMWWEYIMFIGGTTLKLNWPERTLLASRALWFYLGKLVWPTNVTFSYPKWNISAADPYQYLWLIAWLIVGWCMWHWREKIGRGFIAATIFFVVTLLPMIGFLSLYTFRYTYVADHYQYVACIGPILLLAAGWHRLVMRLDERKKRLAAVLPVFVLIVLGILSWRQCHAYKSLENLYGDIIRKNPGSWMAHNNLALHYKSLERFDDSERYYKKALQIGPNEVQSLVNLGIVLGLQGKEDEAMYYFNRTLQVDPNSSDAHFNIGTMLGSQGKFEEAVSHLYKAVQAKPDYAEAHSNLGMALGSLGRYDEAIVHYRQALEIKPEMADTLNNLAVTLRLQGRFDEAVRHFKQALKIDPNYADAHNNLGITLGMQGKFDEAISHFQAALRIRPDFAEAKTNLDLAIKSKLKNSP